MNQSAAQYVTSHVDDEIDLIELVRLLWRRKWVIAAVMVATTAIAAIYAMTATEKWTSIAYVRAPRVEQLKAYLDQRRVFARVVGDKPLDVSVMATKLFDEFIELSATERIKQKFIQGSTYFKSLAKDVGAVGASHALERMVTKDLQVKAPGKSDIAPRYTLSFTADTAATAQQILSGYVQDVNKQVLILAAQSFADRLESSILARQAELGSLEFKEKSVRESYIADLQAALSTARSAGLKEYAGGQNVSGNTVIELRNVNRLFMLGEKYLSAELHTAEKSPLVFSPQYYEVQRELQLLEPLSKHQVLAAQSYSYQLAPSLPINREAPKRGLIVVLGLLLGGMLGCGWVLFAAAIRKSDHSAARKPALPTVSE